MENIAGTIITLLGSGIHGIAGWIGTGLSDLAKNIFLTTTEAGDITGLSVYGSLIIIFASIGLAIGMSRLLVAWLSSLGN